MRSINVRDYGILPGEGRDNVFALRSLLDEIRREEDIELVFSEGTYHFFQENASEILLFIPNHDEDGIKKAAFDLTGMKHLTITGNHSAFMFHTEIIPFLIRDCDTVEIRGISIDYARPGYSQGVILSCSSMSMTIQVDKSEFPYYVKGRRLYFIGENYCHELVRWMELDRDFQKPVYGLVDRTFNLYDAGEAALWSEIEPGVLKVELMEGEKPFEEVSKPGDYLILRHHPRSAPAFYAENSKKISLTDVDIYHATGMGVIAQRTEDLDLCRVRIMRHPTKKHVFSAEADGLHFVSCKGRIHIKDCLIENQLDDPINIHGVYGKITKVMENGSFFVHLMHHQQKGALLLKEGEPFRLLDPETMLPVAESTAVHVKRLNRDVLLVEPGDILPSVKAGWALENMEWIPDVLVEGCTMRNNRARGILPTSAGKVVIRNNVFQVPGAGVLIEGDCRSWFESGAVKHVQILDNLFDCCAYVPNWGYAPIQITPGAARYAEGKAYHGTVEIRKNTFRCMDKRLLFAKNVEKILWKDNIIEHVDTYPPKDGEAFTLEHVLNVKM